MSNNSRMEEGLGDLVWVIIVISIWLTIKYIELVVRAFMLNPRFKPLWVATGFMIIMSLIAYFNQFENWIVVEIYYLSHLILIVMSKAIEVYHGEVVKKEVTKEMVVDEVLHSPWWNTKT
jgi:hypothetical protein